MSKRAAFTAPEAGLLMAAAVSIADDDPTEAESIVLRKFYGREIAEGLEARLRESSLRWPYDRAELESSALARLAEEPAAFRLRSAAIALELAMADGVADQEEQRLLARYAAALGLGMAEIDDYRRRSLRESEAGEETRAAAEPGLPSPPLELDLSVLEAAAALSLLVAASDDDPSEAEAAVLRDYCPASAAESLVAKLEKAGGAWPGDLARCKASLIRCLRELRRDVALTCLTLAYRTATADGVVDPRERALIAEFCDALMVGIGELEACAPALDYMFRSR
jgi:tellurite resistance protein